MRARRGPLGRLGAVADSVSAGLRRRQESREPRVVVYDASGHARVLAPGADGRQRTIEAAERLLDAVGGE